MDLEQFIADEDRPVRTVETPEITALVADLGRGIDSAVDVVGDVAIVVADDDQLEIDLPATPTRAFIKNGVLTIELEENEE